MNFLLEPFQYAFFIQAILATILALSALAMASPTVVANGQSFFSHGISQSMVFGIAAFGGTAVWGVVGAIAAALLAAGTIYLLSKIGWLPGDAGIAVVASGYFALGIILINTSETRDIKVNDILFGDILGISDNELIVLAILALVSVLLFGLAGNRFLLISQNSIAATARGVNVKYLELLRLVSLALATAVTVPIVGALLVVSAIVLPSLIGFALGRTLRQMVILSILAAAASGTIAVFVSYYADLPTGPTIIVSLIITWVLSLTVSRVRELSTATNS